MLPQLCGSGPLYGHPSRLSLHILTPGCALSTLVGECGIAGVCKFEKPNVPIISCEPSRQFPDSLCHRPFRAKHPELGFLR